MLTERQENAQAAEKKREEAQALISESRGWVVHTNRVMASAKDIIAAAINMETGVRGYLLSGKDEFLEPFEEGQKKFKVIRLQLQKTVSDNPAQVQLLGEAMETIDDWKRNVILPLIELRKSIGASKTMDDIRDLTIAVKGKVYFDEFRGLIAEFINIEQGLMETRKLEAESMASQAAGVIFYGVIIAVLMGLAGALLLGQSLAKPFQQLFRGLKSLSTEEIEGTSKVFNNMIGNLENASREINNASDQISQSSQQLASGASEKAASLEETSSSLDQIAEQTKKNSAGAKEASQLANETNLSASTGGEAMERMSETIERIRQSSDDTAKIVSSIDEIAFQTNLLALSAAVEAARAGEAGKGFAVVADEVRNLAQRSAEAARKTAEMIETSQKNAQDGVKVSSEVADALGEIQRRTEKVSGLVGDVSNASEEQARNVDQVNKAIAQIDKVTQQNAASSEEAASSSEELNQQVQRINQMLDELVAITSGKEGGASPAPTIEPVSYQSPLAPFANRKDHGKAIPGERKMNGAKAVAAEEKLLPFDEDEFKEF